MIDVEPKGDREKVTDYESERHVLERNQQFLHLLESDQDEGEIYERESELFVLL